MTTVKRTNTVKNNFWVAALLTGISLFTACSDSEVANEDITSSKINVTPVTVYNDPTELAKRVTLYKDGTSVVSRSSRQGGRLAMPAQPEIPGDAIDMTTIQPLAPAGTKFVLKAGDEYAANLNLNLNNAEWYIAGELKLDGYYWGAGKIYILPGGKLIGNAIGQLSNGIEIYNYGGTLEGFSNLTINAGTVLMTTGDLLDMQNLKIGGMLYVGGNLRAEDMDVNSNAEVYVGKNLTIETKGALTNGASMQVEGKLTAPGFELNSQSSLTIGCAAVFSEKLYLTNKVTLQALSGSYIQSPLTKTTSDVRLIAAENCLLDLGELHIANYNSTSIEGPQEGIAVVKTTDLYVNGNDLRGTFTGHLALFYDRLHDDGSQNKVEFLSNILINPTDSPIYIPATECGPGFGGTSNQPEQPGGSEAPDTPVQPEKPAQKVLKLEHIADLISPEAETNNLSATCVQMSGNYAYVSYHERGSGYNGWVDIISFESGEPQILSSMKSEAQDFNHLIPDDGQIYLAGGRKSGAFLASVRPEGNRFPEGLNSIKAVALEGSDANCVVRSGDSYLVAATGGFQRITAADWQKNTEKVDVERVKEGHGKFIHQNGDKMLTLDIEKLEGESAEARTTLYGANDNRLAVPATILGGDIITPANGKNVACADGAHIYLCLGANGLKRYTNGTEGGVFKLEGKNSAVNGADFDDRYLYVACGNAGVYVLDKNTLQPVASYTHSGGKSANYVRAANGYVFVAYGKSGLQVFKLVEIE